MLENIILLFLEKICEAIYFSLFLIYGKNLKEKRLLFISIMIFEYILLTSILQYTIWIHISYIAMIYINLKVIYKEKAQITDIFLFATASIILIMISFLCGIILFTHIEWYKCILALNRIIILSLVYIFRNKIYDLYKKFWSNWNRKHKPKIKSLTLRNISVIIFNLMFYIINTGMLFALAFKFQK